MKEIKLLENLTGKKVTLKEGVASKKFEEFLKQKGIEYDNKMWDQMFYVSLEDFEFLTKLLVTPKSKFTLFDNTINSNTYPGFFVRIAKKKKEEIENLYGPEYAREVSKIVHRKLTFDDYDANDRPIFISGKEEDEMEYTIDEKGNVWSHDGYSDTKIGKIQKQKQ